jgi:hypothetical protein
MGGRIFLVMGEGKRENEREKESDKYSFCFSPDKT